MATMNELFKVWIEDGAYIYTKDGRCIPIKQLWEEQYSKPGVAEEFEKVFRSEE